MLPIGKKIIGPDYKEAYKRNIHSKFLSTDPEVKKRFGVFKVTELLKPEDKNHFHNLYNYKNEVLEQYKLPEEKREKENIVNKAKEIKIKKDKELAPKSADENNIQNENTIEYDNNNQDKNENNLNQNSDEIYNKKLKEVLLQIFDPNIQKEEIKELEEELYVKKGSKTDEHFKTVTNGEKAVQFFAMYGNTTPIKFIFCIKEENNKPNNFCPYELKVIDPSKAKDDYFIITPSGITHVFGSASVSNKNKPLTAAPAGAEFYTLSDWMYQSTLFNILKHINYYKHYLPFKILTIWRNYNRFKKYLTIRNKLGNKLFLTKPAFVDKLITCNGLLLQLDKTKFHKVAGETAWNSKGLVDFDDEQKNVIEKAKSKLKHVVEVDIFDSLRQLYKIISTRFKETRDIDETENSKSLQELRNKSMSKLKLERQMRKKLIKMAHNDIETYDRFINMIDLMTVQLTYSLIKKNLKDMRMELYRERKDSNSIGIFTLIVSYCNGYHLVPDEKDIEDKFKQVFKHIVEQITEVPRFISIFCKRDYDNIFFNVSDEFSENDRNSNTIISKNNDSSAERTKRNFKEIIEKSKFFKKFTEAIYSRLKKEYDSSMLTINETYKNFLPLQYEKENSPVSNFLSMKPNIDIVQKKLDDLKIWWEKVEKLPTSLPWGIMNLFSQSIKDEYLSHIKLYKDSIERDFIKRIFLEIKIEIRDETTETRNMLLIKKKYNSGNTAICEFKKALNIYTEKKDSLARKVEELEILYKLIKQYKIETVSGNDISEYEQIIQSFLDNEKNINESYDEINKMKPNMVEGIYNDISLNNLKINDLNRQITSGIYIEICDPSEYDSRISGISIIESNINLCIETCSKLNSQLKILEAISSEEKNDELEKLKKNYEIRKKLWINMVNLYRDRNEWRTITLNQLKNAKVEDRISSAREVCNELQEDLSDQMADNVLNCFKEKVDDIESYLPVISALSSTSLLDRHWREIFSIIRVEFQPDELGNVTLGDMIDNYNIMEHITDIDSISAAAVAQEKITKDLDKIEKDWSVMKFPVVSHGEHSKDKFIISSVEEIFTQSEEHSQLVVSALNSKHLNDIKARVNEWDDNLNLINRVIEEWLMVQRQWIYLENIFSAEDIKKQLPDTSKNFNKVNKGFKDLMYKTKENPNVLERCKQDCLLDQLIRFNKELDTIQKSLEDYLQTKRKAFPRFYFLSNDELLKILSQTRSPRAVQNYLNKCFDGIKSINFTTDYSLEIIAMISPENELVRLFRSVLAHENIEEWLKELEEVMFTTIYEECKKCLENYPDINISRRDWIYNDYPCQAVITVDQIIWASLVEKQFDEISSGKSESIKEFSKYMEKQIFELAELVTERVSEIKTSLVERLIIINVHARDVVKDLIKEGVEDKNNFEWQKNLKFYWEYNKNIEDPDSIDKNEIVIRQTNCRFIYGYEYLGNPERMVITPLTDKCYITLTSALHLNYGGAPAGPAGTGKTETTKDLSKALAIKVNVFNCTDQLDYRLMGRMFCGLAECGAWACFDEFNRIDVEVLSVIAQQIEGIQTALREKRWDIPFDGKQIKLKSRFGVFITMNPGYAGRTELPDNLKSLFRPVAMMIPDYSLVSEVTLYSKGFKEAKELSVKMFQLFKLSSEQLSKQKHYDFGLRGIKSILSRAGYLRSKYAKDPEKEVLIRAMKDSNLPKFLDADIELFLDIINDLFPYTKVEQTQNEVFINKVQEVLEKENLMCIDKFIEKITQLQDTMMVRLGNMIVGQTGTGKSTLFQTLSRTLTELGKNKELSAADNWYCQINLNILNPKAVTKFELYMAKDEVTQTWEDGIVAKLMRDAEEEEKSLKIGQISNTNTPPVNKRRWIVFDGPVDALWIEDMNTVLDDSRKLCLPDSSNIRIPKMMNLIFEVQDLRVASPATVSRCGMIYLESHHVGYVPIIETWNKNYKSKLIKAFEEDGVNKSMKERFELYINQVDKISNNLKSILPRLLSCLKSECKEKIPSNEVNLVQSCLNLISCFFNTDSIYSIISNIEQLCNYYLAFSVIWSIGANIDDKSRIGFSKVIEEVFKKLSVNFEGYDIYDVYVNEKCIFNRWIEKKKPYVYKSQPFFNILVPTSDTEKYKYLMENFNKNNYCSLFMGETGVGKSVIILDYLNTLNQENFLFKSSNFSAKTSSKNVFEVLKSAIFKNGNFQPPQGKKFIYFIDDINLPQLDDYGSQQPIEFIRQLIDNKSFYDEKKTQKKIKDVIFMAACAPPSGGRNKVTPRLFRHFNMIWMTDLSSGSMKQIFKLILEGFLEPIKSLCDEVDDIMEGQLELYNKIRTVKLPTPSKSHYTFNLRDLSKVIQGMLQINVMQIENKKTLVNLCIHEMSRQFRDRLIGNDIQWFDNEIEEIYETKFKLVREEMVNIEKLIFTTVIDRNYRIITEYELLTKKIEEEMTKYNNSSKTGSMNIVFFTDAINHFCRITRILNQDRGNALLIGLGGSGRQSLVRLVGYSMKYEINCIQTCKGYGVDAFWKDIAKILIKTGCTPKENKEKHQIFLFSDTQILFESFLEDINNILNNGEVPNLFKDDEMGQIFNMCKDEAKNESKDSVYQYFVSKVRNQLHIVLSFSPVGDNFRNRCRQFPSIINCCTIDWFNIWPDDALKSVAERNLAIIGQHSSGSNSSGGNNLLSGLTPFSEGLTISLGRIFVKIQTKALELSIKFLAEQRRSYYITPTSYLEFIKLFIDIYAEKISIIPKQINNYKLGIDKLEEANTIVKNLKQELIELEPLQIQKKSEVEDLIINLEQNKKIVDVEKEKIQVDKDSVEIKRNEILRNKEECDLELDKAKPQLELATKALEGLDEPSVRELRSYNIPVEPIVNLSKVICYVFEVKQDYSEFKKLAGKKDFIEKCKDKDELIKKLNDPRKLRELGKLYSSIETVDYHNISGPAECFKKWVGAMISYIHSYRIVKPKMDALEKANKELEKVEAELFDKSKILREKLDELDKLQKSFDDANKQLFELSESIKNINIKSIRAVRLVSGLKDEGKRWRDNIIKLESEEKNLLANVIISASIVSYFGPFTIEYRKEFLTSVIGFIRSENIYYFIKETQTELNTKLNESKFDIQEILSDQMQIREWTYAGLPADDLSIENAIITARSKRWPLIIDPQMQANKWIKNYYKNQGIKSYKISDKNLFNRIKDCIMSGYVCLIENVEQSLDSSLEPFLAKQLSKQGNTTYLLGLDKPLQYIPSFKLYMTSKLSNPHYLPEISIKVTLINFTVTQKGLEDQLLVDVVKFERPDLEAQKDALVLSINENKKAIKDLEQTILTMVKDASKEILENDVLVNKLDQSKKQSEKITEDLTNAEATSKKINRERIGYRVIATRGSIIYFVIASLANIDSMYNYSLEYFSKLFNQRLEKSEQNCNVEKRISILIDDITINYYQKISRGLFEKDKLLYSFLIIINIHLNQGDFTQLEWNFFLKGGSALNKIDENHSYYKNKIDKWMDLETYQKLLTLKEVSFYLLDIEDKLNQNSLDNDNIRKWQEFLISETPHLCILPDNIEQVIEKCRIFRLIFVKTLREEKLIMGIKHYINDKRFLESPQFNIQAAYEDSLKTTPLIFMLSPGANPVNFLRNFAKDKKINLTNISLGQGQGEIAKNAILRSKDNGNWVCLENCHLSTSWMPKLEEIIEEVNENPDIINCNFRLWLTTMPSNKFPVSILQSGVKITNEPPKGIKANLKSTFLNIKEEDMISDFGKTFELSKLLFSLAFFHTIILERRKFGALGWNIPYEWMNSDFDTSKLHLKMYVEAYNEIPLTILNYLVSVINYGGRVTDDKDAKLISAILNKYFNVRLFDNDYKYSESGIYYAPNNFNNMNEIQVYLENLPLDDEPEVFGLHSNANISLQNKLVLEFMEPLVSIQPRTSGAGKSSPDEDVIEMKNFISQRFTKENINLIEISLSNPKSILEESSKDKKSPLGNFLMQEVEKFNNLINVIKMGLATLEAAVEGKIVMSQEIEKVYQSFLIKQVPKFWEENAYPSLKPLSSWTVDLTDRIKFISKWLYDGPPKSVWISSFFFPQGFNTAVLQTYARKTKLPIDSLTFSTNILSFDKMCDAITIPEDGLNIHGLYLQGASWDWNSSLIKEQPPKELWHEMPCIWLKPIKTSQLYKNGYYECPLYKTSKRAGELSTTGHSTNFVMYLYLKYNANEDSDHWIRRGAALITQTDN